MPNQKDLAITYAEGIMLVAVILLVGYLKTHSMLVDILELFIILAIPFFMVLIDRGIPPRTKYSVSRTVSAMGFLAIVFPLKNSLGFWWAFLWATIFYFLFCFVLSRINKDRLFEREKPN